MLSVNELLDLINSERELQAPLIILRNFFEKEKDNPEFGNFLLQQPDHSFLSLVEKFGDGNLFIEVLLKTITYKEKNKPEFGNFLLQKHKANGKSFLSFVEEYGDKKLFAEIIVNAITYYPEVFKNESYIKIVQKMIVDGNDIFLELKNIRNKQVAIKLFETVDALEWNSLHLAIHYQRERYLDVILSLLGEDAFALCKAKSYLPGSRDGHNALWFASTKMPHKIPDILKALGDKALEAASQKGGWDKTCFHLLAQNDEDSVKAIIPSLRVLGIHAAPVSEIKDNEGETFQRILEKRYSPHGIGALDQTIRHKSVAEAWLSRGKLCHATSSFSWAMMIHPLSEALFLYIQHYLAIENAKTFVTAVHYAGVPNNAYWTYQSKDKNNTLEKELNALLQKLALVQSSSATLMIKKFLSFLLDSTIDLEQKTITGIIELTPTLLNIEQLKQNPDVYYDNVIKVLADRLVRHDEFVRTTFNNASNDSNRKVNQFFDDITQQLLEAENIKEKAYPYLHPCGAAYRLIAAKMKPDSGYDGEQVKNWFIELLQAKKNNSEKIDALIFRRPRKNLFTSSKTDKEEAHFKATMLRFFAANEIQMNEFWLTLQEQHKSNQNHDPLLDELIQLALEKSKDTNDAGVNNFENNPGVIAYRVIVERITKPLAPEEQKAEEWFLKLLKAHGSIKETTELLKHGQRPSKSSSFSLFDDREKGFKAAMVNFCKASDDEMSEFWRFCDEESKRSSALERGFLQKIISVRVHTGHMEQVSGGESSRSRSKFNYTSISDQSL